MTIHLSRSADHERAVERTHMSILDDDPEELAVYTLIDIQIAFIGIGRAL
jgi:hypothetical protein